MLKKANSLSKKWRSKGKKKNVEKAKDESSESNLSFREDVKGSLGTDNERQDYEEKLRTMREELNGKYNQQMEGMKKREASTTLRLNTKLACIARQRDEMETKLHLVEKKYEDMKKKLSGGKSLSTALKSESATKDGRSVDDGGRATKDSQGVNNGSKGTKDVRSVNDGDKATKNIRGIDNGSGDTRDIRSLDDDARTTKDIRGADDGGRAMIDIRCVHDSGRATKDIQGVDVDCGKATNDIRCVEDGGRATKDARVVHDGGRDTKDTRSIDEGGKDSVPRFDSGVENGQSDNMTEIETNLRYVKSWMKKTNGIIDSMREQLTEIQHALSTMNGKFEKFVEFHGGERMRQFPAKNEKMEREQKARSTANELQDEHSNLENKPFNGGEGELSGISGESSSIKDEEDKPVSEEFNLGPFSLNSSNAMNEQLQQYAEVVEHLNNFETQEIEHFEKDKSRSESYKNGSKKPLQNNSLDQKNTSGRTLEQKNHNISQKRGELPIDLKTKLSDQSESSSSVKDSSENDSIKEEPVSECDVGKNFKGDGLTRVGIHDLAAEVTKQLEIPLMYFLNRYEQLSKEITVNSRKENVDCPPVWDGEKDETTSFYAHQKLGMRQGHEKECAKTCACVNNRNPRIHFLAYRPDNGPYQANSCSSCRTANFSNDQIHYCRGTYCCKCYTKCPNARTEKCHRCRSENCVAYCTEACQKYGAVSAKCPHGDFLKNDRCMAAVHHKVLSSDYVQRHVVKSSAIIANLRDLKPEEE